MHATGVQAQMHASSPPAEMPMEAPAETGPALDPILAKVVLRTSSGVPSGEATLRQLDGGVEVSVQASGISAGLHGVHIHAKGSCDSVTDPVTGHIADFEGAGGHFDPAGSHQHGGPEDAQGMSHAGELPNLEAGAERRGTMTFVNPRITLSSGKTAVLGRTLIVHDQPDDYRTDPSGNSGGRVLCGLIVPANPAQVVDRQTLEGDHVFPHGVAMDISNNALYVGSGADGSIQRLARNGARSEIVAPGGAVGRNAAYGMQMDEDHRLWVAGGPSGSVAIVDPNTGATLSLLQAPRAAQTFINDLTIARDGFVYVTDSARPVLFRASSQIERGGRLEPWLDLSRTAIRYQPQGVNLNGIVSSPDGKWLLAIQSVTGQLWRIDTRTKAVTQVRVDGDLIHGNGLALTGSDLYVVRGNEREVVRLSMNDGWTQGRVIERLHDARLRHPTAAVMTNEGLVVVNSQEEALKAPPPLLPFDTITLRKP